MLLSRQLICREDFQKMVMIHLELNEQEQELSHSHYHQPHYDEDNPLHSHYQNHPLLTEWWVVI